MVLLWMLFGLRPGPAVEVRCTNSVPPLCVTETGGPVRYVPLPNLTPEFGRRP